MSLVSTVGVVTGVIAGISTFGFYFFFVGWIVNPRPHLAPKTGPISVSYTHLTLPTNREV